MLCRSNGIATCCRNAIRVGKGLLWWLLVYFIVDILLVTHSREMSFADVMAHCSLIPFEEAADGTFCARVCTA